MSLVEACLVFFIKLCRSDMKQLFGDIIFVLDIFPLLSVIFYCLDLGNVSDKDCPYQLKFTATEVISKIAGVILQVK